MSGKGTNRRKSGALGSFWQIGRQRRASDAAIHRAQIKRSGLFSSSWYLRTYADVAQAGIDPVEHFLQAGAAERRRPNPVFDTDWYLRAYHDVSDVGLNPLVHYIQWGESEGRSPSPHFETKWYREKYQALLGTRGPLAHYLANRHTRRFSPNHIFDVEFYLRSNPDVAAAEIEPFEHFISTGYKERRDPSPDFDVRFYCQRYLLNDPRDPVTHYFEIGRAAGLPTTPKRSNVTQADEIRHFTSKSPEFEEFDPRIAADARHRAKVIAFYLPQFHRLPENDQWWGKGFTEWTNVTRGTPRFTGHYQPRVPRDFGFYDLSNPEVMARQVEVAKAAGIHGFCFYYYNFNGKRLLEKPVNDFLARPEVDFPFCLIWANENWTRRWDGEESEVLMRQDYSCEDAIRLVDDVARHFQDARYIRVAGRPVFFVYRPDVIPDTAATLKEWRALFADRHGVNPWIFMAQSFDNVDPVALGFDGAVEFPPHKTVRGVNTVNAQTFVFDDHFSAQVYRYDDLVESSLAEPAPSYPLFKTVFPSWDNDARRQGRGMSVRDASPKKYGKWLGAAIQFARANRFHDESFVFVNAWNEWAEGAYLEPDLHFGAAYLNETARVVTGQLETLVSHKVLLVGHDAFPAGSQLLLLNLARTLKGQFGLDIRVLLGQDGELLPAYQDVAITTVALEAQAREVAAQRLASEGFRTAIVNTTASAALAETLKRHDFHILSLIHELPGIIAEKGLASHARTLARDADEIVFAAEPIRDAFLQTVGNVSAPQAIRPQGLYNAVTRVEGARESVRDELALSPDAVIAINVGYADLRKGVDLFCATATLLAQSHPEIVFVWVGDLDPVINAWVARLAPPNVRFIGRRDDIARLLSAADVFVLTSREDPYPSVLLEALAVELPLVAFAGAGGFAELFTHDYVGTLVPLGDTVALSHAIFETVCNEPKVAAEVRRARSNLIAQRFAFDDYAFSLVERTQPGLQRISVIVPNYNYARYLGERLNSIFGQTYPVYEIIVLDDASTDNSLEMLGGIAETAKRRIRVVPNAVNSGSVFAQWAKGIEMARGDLIWIAEADDIADRAFLERLAPHFKDAETSFALSDSRAIDADGKVIYESYKTYYARLGPDTLAEDFVTDSRDFAARYLAQRNLILNVSSVLWRKASLQRALKWSERDLPDYKLAGDWRLYLGACAAGGKVAYCADPLNSHRRHDGGVTQRLKAENHLEEVKQVHAFFNASFGAEPVRLRAQEEYIDELREQFERASA